MRAVLIMLVAILPLIGAGCSEPPVVDDGPTSFADCLYEQGAIMYGTEWCSHCQNQKSLFGASFGLINYIDCDRNQDECLAAGVKGYPTWKINGQNYAGEQSLGDLSRLSGCVLDG